MAPFARPESFERILWDFSRENPWLIILFALTVLILPVQYVVMPYMYGQIIQSIEKRRPFLRPLVAVLAIILATQAVIMASEWQETTVYPRLQEFTRDRLLMRLIAAQSKDYYELETGRILSVLSKLPTAITQYIDVARNNVVPHLMVYIMVAAFLVTVDGCLAAALAFTGLSSWILAIWSPSLCAQASTRRDRSFNLVNEAVDDLLKNLMTVLNLDQVDSERRRLSDLMREYKAHSIRSMACYSAPRTVVVVIHIAFVAYYV